MGALDRLRAVPAIMAVNVAVFVAWRASLAHEPLRRFLELHFQMNLADLREGRPWTIVTAAFSHSGPLHILINMLVLLSFGTVLELRWGPRQFTVFYLAAAVAAALGHDLLGALGWPDVPALGASGAIAGLVVAYVFIHPRHKILLFLLLPLPAWVACVLFVGFDVMGLVAQREGGGLPIGHGAHLGGAAFGAAWSIAVRLRHGAPEPEAEEAPFERNDEDRDAAA